MKDLNIRTFILVGLLVSLLIAIFVSPFASPSPDGLEKVAEIKGFLQKGEEWVLWKLSLMPDYSIPGIKKEGVATGLSGFIGTLIVFGVGYGVARLIRSKRS
jgi:cobalt/nickel transport protein